MPGAMAEAAFAAVDPTAEGSAGEEATAGESGEVKALIISGMQPSPHWLHPKHLKDLPRKYVDSLYCKLSRLKLFLTNSSPGNKMIRHEAPTSSGAAG